MTDQTTEDTAAYCTCSAMRAIVDHHLKPMSAEVNRLRAALQVADEIEADRDSDPVVLDLRAQLAEARAESRTLGVSLAETIQERQQLRTRLADAEQTRRAALAVAADLTEDLAEARAETDRQRHEREKYTERWDALDQAAGALHGWTIYPTTDGGLMVSHDTDADRPTLAADDSIPLAAVLAFIASHTDDDTTE